MRGEKWSILTRHEMQFLKLELNVLLKRLRKAQKRAQSYEADIEYRKTHEKLREEVRQKAKQYIKEVVYTGMGGYYLVDDMPVLQAYLEQIMTNPELKEMLKRSLFIEPDMGAVREIALQLRHQTEKGLKELQSHAKGESKNGR